VLRNVFRVHVAHAMHRDFSVTRSPVPGNDHVSHAGRSCPRSPKACGRQPAKERTIAAGKSCRLPLSARIQLGSSDRKDSLVDASQPPKHYPALDRIVAHSKIEQLPQRDQSTLSVGDGHDRPINPPWWLLISADSAGFRNHLCRRDHGSAR